MFVRRLRYLVCAVLIVVGADARAQTAKSATTPDQRPKPRRDAALELLAADAAGLPPELAADALIRIAASPRVSDNTWKRELLTRGIQPPEMDTEMNGRHVLVVVRGYHYREDLAALRPYIREYKPVMVAVDGGADALIEAGYQPDAILGDMDSVSDEALCCGAELVVHAYPDGRAPGLARVRELGLDAVTHPAPGTSEDVALLVADARGASLIAVVGTHHTLEEFLDKGRPGMSSTFITHLRVGSKLVNARGVHQLYHSRISGWSLLVLVLAAAVTVFVAVVFSPASPILARYFEATWHSFTYWLTGKL